VEALCLRLQDEHGQCVSFLLWAAWAGAQGRRIDATALREAASMARGWETTVLRPLRSARRALKTARPGLPAAEQAALGARVQAEELTAERLLLEALETKAGAAPSGPADVRRAVEDAARAWDPASRPGALLDDFSGAFSSA
jgi:uncharacterized protein (TIGR02444 family)